MNWKPFFIAGLAMYLSTAIYNIGIVAMDDYESSIAPVVPAQQHAAKDIIGVTDFRSPLPGLTLHLISSTAYKLGVENPVTQYRFVLGVWAFVAFCLLFYFTRRALFLTTVRQSEQVTLGMALICFYFLGPLFLSRPMIESLAAPFLLGSAVMASSYARSKKVSQLVLSLFLLVIASVYRFQAGVCFLALFVTAAIVGRVRDAVVVVVLGIMAFVGVGLIDGAMKGGFHTTLRQYVAFNAAHSSSFGVTPFYTFALLFLGFSIPPTFFSRYRGFRWRDNYRPLMPLVLYFVVFFTAHSAVPHKEERFAIPVLPIFLVLLVPLATELWVARKEKWRWMYFAAVNVPLLFIGSYSIIQNNVVAMAQYLDRETWAQKVYELEDTAVLFPGAFILRPLAVQGHLSPQQFSAMHDRDCSRIVLARRDLLAKVSAIPPEMEPVAEFKPGLLERLVVKLNPRNNARRDSIFVYRNRGCR